MVGDRHGACRGNTAIATVILNLQSAGLCLGGDCLKVDDLSAAASEFNSEVSTANHGALRLPIALSEPLFIVGPNGSGKSALIQELYSKNHPRAVRLAGHRPTWIRFDASRYSPEQARMYEAREREMDRFSAARWAVEEPHAFAGIVISKLIDADRQNARVVRDALRARNVKEAARLVEETLPLAAINEIYSVSGLPIRISLEPNGELIANKRGGGSYGIAQLSDGERAVFLMAATILTAQNGCLILVDEPERHLHPSIIVPLLQNLFIKRPDCAFVISTHDVSLPSSFRGAPTVLVRDAVGTNDEFRDFDLDILEPGMEIDDATKEAIIGARRRMLFIEGDAGSRDKLLYEILFPEVSLSPRSTCGDVINAVKSIRNCAEVTWVQAFGIVDQDQLTIEQKRALEEQGVFAISLYSVEALYYNPLIVTKIAERQCAVLGSDPAKMEEAVWSSTLSVFRSNLDRLAARMVEQAVKDEISLKMPDWKKIAAGQNVSIEVDAQSHFQAERSRLEGWIAAGEIDKIIARYPIRDTSALGAIANALQFTGLTQYESAVRKLVLDEPSVRTELLKFFGNLPAAIG